MGCSNGGLFGLDLARNIAFKKMLIVNSYLQVKVNKLDNFLKSLNTEIVFVFGEEDSYFNYLDYFKKEVKSFQIEIIKNADHYFTGMLNEFIDLPNKFLF